MDEMTKKLTQAQNDMMEVIRKENERVLLQTEDMEERLYLLAAQLAGVLATATLAARKLPQCLTQGAEHKARMICGPGEVEIRGGPPKPEAPAEGVPMPETVIHCNGFAELREILDGIEAHERAKADPKERN